MKIGALVLAIAISLVGRPVSGEAGEKCLWVNADYLYWHAAQTNMSYGVVTDNLVDFANLLVLNQSTDLTSAFRLGVHYRPPCSCWGASFAWTRFHNTASGSSSQELILATQLLAPNVNFIVGGGSVGGPATSQWRLRLDMFDLNFTAPVCGCRPCRFTPYVGLKGGIINQTELIKYINFENSNNQQRVNATVTQVNDFSGVGLKAGFGTNYCIGCGFSLVGDFAMAAMYGDVFSRDQTVMEEAGVVGIHSSKSSVNRFVPLLQLFLGLDWTCCCMKCATFSIGAGYEMQHYWNTWRTQNSSIQDFFVTNVGFGDLILHGLTVKFALGY